MELIYPSYYHQFRCIAGACPDSCCHEWDVQVDPEAAGRYQALEGPLGEDLRRSLYDEDGETYLRNRAGRCPMWRSDGLCRIQAELGHEALCQTCRDFPRLRQDYGTFVELGLEMSCPEAARIMLTSDDWRLDSQTLPGGDEPEYDIEVMDILRQSRPAALALLQDEKYPVNARLAQLLMYAYHIQAQIDGADAGEFDPSAALAEAQGFAAGGDIQALLDFFSGLEVLTARWQEMLDAGSNRIEWTEELCKLAQHGVYRYYHQAVSDYDLVCRVKLIVAGCILIAALSAPDFESRLAIIQLYSKEIENDADNIDAILDGAYTQHALTDANLLGLLMR